jgi:hypothetical protein
MFTAISLMSALGHEQTSAHVRVMSALPPKADMLRLWAGSLLAWPAAIILRD